MIQFDFELDPAEGSFLGHMTVTGPTGCVTTKGRSPDQSVMLVLSVAELLSTVRHLRLNPNVRAGLFRAIDSSFELLFERRRTRREGERVIVGHRGAAGEVTFDELEDALRSAAGRLFREQWAAILADDLIRETVIDSARDFGIDLPRDGPRDGGGRLS